MFLSVLVIYICAIFREIVERPRYFNGHHFVSIAAKYVGTFNQKKVLVGAFSVNVKSLGIFV